MRALVVAFDKTQRYTAGLVLNSGAGRAGAAIDPQSFASDLVDVRVYETSRDCSPADCARAALAEGAKVLIAAGGDGTVSGVAAALVNSSVPLGILPLGTANSIARALGIPTDIEEAAHILREALRGDIPPRWIDTALANKRTMVLLAAIGLHACAVAEAPSDAKKHWGSLAYVLTAIRKLRAQAPFTARLTIGEDHIECRATNITVANLAPPQTVSAQGPTVVMPDDGWLDATIVAADTVPSVLGAGWHLLRCAFSGEPAERDDIGYAVAKRFVIDADPPQPVLIDGEEAGTTPVEVVLRPKSLLVLAPPAPPAEKPVERKLDGLPGLKIDRAHGR
jgi:YegS/Rv2252/BmrU family lipid kinase